MEKNGIEVHPNPISPNPKSSHIQPHDSFWITIVCQCGILGAWLARILWDRYTATDGYQLSAATGEAMESCLG